MQDVSVNKPKDAIGFVMTETTRLIILFGISFCIGLAIRLVL